MAEAITTTTIITTTTLEVGEGKSSLLMYSAAFCTIVQDILLNPLVSECAFLFAGNGVTINNNNNNNNNGVGYGALFCLSLACGVKILKQSPIDLLVKRSSRAGWHS